MIVLSRIWYVVLAIVAGICAYVAGLGVSQFNRQVERTELQGLHSDAQAVTWAMQIDARRRLDSLIKFSSEKRVREGLKIANLTGTTELKDEGSVPLLKARSEAQKAIEATNEKLPVEYKFDALFVVTSEGRIFAQNGFDVAASYPEFELGGYAVVFDALHGFLRDDTWMLGGKMYRVVARPVEDEVGLPPLGAIVALTTVDTKFVTEISKRTQTGLLFFSQMGKLAFASTSDPLIGTELDRISNSEILAVSKDVAFRENGRLGPKFIETNSKISGIYTKMWGEAQDLGAGFLVIRDKPNVSGMFGFFDLADDVDKTSARSWLVMFIVFFGALVGLILTYFELSRPLKQFITLSRDLRQGSIDSFPLAKLNASFRGIAENMNEAISLIVERRGGTPRKAADLNQILGTTDPKLAMSAFSFGTPASSALENPLPVLKSVTESSSSQPSNGRPPPPSSPRQESLPSPASPPSPPPSPPSPPNPASSGSTLAVPPIKSISPPAPGSGGGSPTPLLAAGSPPPSVSGGSSPTPIVALAAGSPPAPVVASTSSGAPTVNQTSSQKIDSLSSPSVEASLPAPLAVQLSSPSAKPIKYENDRQLYDEFIKVRIQCGESSAAFTFEKFKENLDKQRQTLAEKHKGSQFQFSVYVKEGRAALKAVLIRNGQ